MRKICHVTSVHGRYDPRIFSKQCRSLVCAGYDVSLVVNDELHNEVSDGVKIVSTGYKPKNRINRFLVSRRNLFDLVKEVDADVYHFHDPELIPIATKIKRQFGRTVIFDFHENTERQILDKEWIPYPLRSLTANLYATYEKRAIRRYDALISVTPEIVERLRVTNKNTVMVTNYPIIESSVKRRTDKSTLCFAGGVSEQWCHAKIIEALERVGDVKYLLFGSGPKEYLDYLKELPGWAKVDYRGRIPHSEVKREYYNASIGMALNYSTQIKGEGTLGNTKLFEYMEAALPVICSDYRLWKDIVEQHQCGIAVNPHDVGEIAQAIEYLVNNPEDAIQMGQNGRRAIVEHYNWGTQEAVLIDLYDSLLGVRRGSYLEDCNNCGRKASIC